MARHAIRDSESTFCKVCGAPPGHPCVEGTVKDSADPRDTETGQAEWLEFAILRDSKRLEELRPDHWLAIAIRAACEAQPIVNGGQEVMRF